MDRVLTMLLAGGAGERLIPLSRRQAKPAVRFGGNYRLIDFTLSNCVNSGLRQIFCLTQYKALELSRHIREGWNLFSGELGEFIEVLPPMQRMNTGWYLGTADAVYQNIASIFDQNPTQVLIVAGDHIYKMNYDEMLYAHRAAGAAVTVATLQADPAETARFGVADIDPASHLIRGFQEKPAPASAVRSTFDPAMVSVSMGVYVFETNVLLGLLSDDAANPDSSWHGRRTIFDLYQENRLRVSLGCLIAAAGMMIVWLAKAVPGDGTAECREGSGRAKRPRANGDWWSRTGR